MLPVECVVRNIALDLYAVDLELKKALNSMIHYLNFLKDDELGDPLINDNHIIAFGWGTQEEIEFMKKQTFLINKVLCRLFDEANLILVDYKVEYGRSSEGLLLGDEFTPDGCRIWDKDTGESLGKDRFGKDLGDVVESIRL